MAKEQEFQNWIKKAGNQNFLAVYDVMLSIQEELEISPNKILIPILPQFIKFRQLFPVDSIGTRDTYIETRWKALQFLQKNGIIAQCEFKGSGHRWKGKVSLTLDANKFDQSLQAMTREYQHRTSLGKGDPMAAQSDTNIKERQFMELAIKEMLASRAEHGDRPDPLVGAVICDKQGKLLDKARRGGLRDGDHCEYTLLERLLGNKNLEGSTLYVTLEPCTKRNPPKVPCAQRVKSARIGKVVIGMPDPNPEIEGKGIHYLLKHGIKVEFFDHDLFLKIQKANKEFIEYCENLVESPDVVTTPAESPSHKEKEPVPHTSLNHLDHGLVKKYLELQGRGMDIPSHELGRYFETKGLAVHRNGHDHIEDQLTLASFLLFGTHPEELLTQSKVKVEAKIGGKTVVDDIAGPLLLMPEKIKTFLDKHMTKYTEIREFERIEIPEYPWEALREAVVNAIVHRDYQEGAHVLIQLGSKELTIKSPGLPPRPLSLAKIQSFNAPPLSRNPRIAEIFNQFNLMEERGWGLQRMRDILVEHGNPTPKFDFNGSYFVVTFYPGEASREITQRLSDRQRKLITLIRARGSVTSTECASDLKLTDRTILRDLGKLVELGIAERHGSGPSTTYTLKSGAL